MESLTELPEIDELIALLNQQDWQLPDHYHAFNAAYWARVLEALTNEQRLKLWQSVPDDLTSSVLAELHDDTRQQFLAVLSEREIAQSVASSSHADAVDIIEVLPESSARQMIKKLSQQAQSQVALALSFSEDQVGRYANQQVYTVDESENVAEVIDELKRGENDIDSTNFIVLRDNTEYVGELSINDLLNSNRQGKIANLVHADDLTLNAEQSLLEAANLVKESQRNFLVVLHSNGHFYGIFSIQDALDVFQEFYEAQVAHMGQVSDEDLFSPVLASSKRRAVWLGINLATAFLASVVIGLFDKVLVEVVALAVLMPVVASMGGITGSQSLTLTIRGVATGQISRGNLSVLRNKEFLVALINSLGWAVLVALVSFYWFDNMTLAAIIAVSIVINMLVAAFSGVYIPIILERFGIDPAIAGSVILTTVTDVVGFFVFLGGASLVFLAG